MLKLLTLTIVLGIVVAEPLQKRSISVSNDLLYTDGDGYELLDKPFYVSTAMGIITSLIGYKVSALSLAVSCIGWFISNAFTIFAGMISVLGFCKFTGKCSFNYDQYIPVAQLEGLATPENIDNAQKFLLTAVEKYAEKK